MACVLRLMPIWAWFVVGCLIGAVPQLAFAQTAGTNYSLTFDTSCSGTAISACQAMQSAWGAPVYQYPGGDFVAWRAAKSRAHAESLSFGTVAWSTGTVTYSGSVTTAYGINSLGGQVTVSLPYSLGGAQQMTFNTKFTGGASCTAPNVIDSVTGKCGPAPNPCAEHAGKWWSAGYGWNASFPVEDFSSGSGSAIPTTGCMGGCTVTYERSMGAYGSGQWWQIASSKATGQTCSASTPVPVPPVTGPKTPETSPEYDCAKNGQGWGTYNGTVICTGPATEQTKTEKDTTKTTNPDGTKTTTTKETACTGGTCTETTTTTNCDANGENCTASTSTSEKTGQGDGGEGEGDEPESKWGGACGSEPACSGDAIQCAQTKAVWEMNCRYRASDGQTTAEKIVAGNDPKAGQMPWAEGNIEQMNVSTMLNTNEQFGAACVPDLAFSVGGKSVVVPLSNACNWLGWIGNIMLAGAMLAGLGIAFGRPQ